MTAAPLASRPFVGRRTELELLHDRRRALAKNAGSVVLVAGEAGMGKSRLLKQFVAGIPGVRTPLLARAECLQAAGQPLGPLREIVSALVEQAPWIEERASDVAAQALAYFAPASARGVARDASLGQGGLFVALARLLSEIAAKRATILTIEDLHWADSSTLEFLAFLAPRVPKMRLLVVATLRDDEIDERHPSAGAIGRLLREQTTQRIRLNPLEPPDVSGLLHAAARDAGLVAPALLEGVARRSEGNPLFAEELFRSLLENGTNVAGDVPFSIRALTAASLARLDDATRSVIVHAAVLGYRFDPELVAATLERPLNTIAYALRQARDRGLLIEEASGRFRMRFRHALTRDAIAAGTLRIEAARMHERAALALTAFPGAEARVEELAHHWWEAGNAEKIREYGERAGDAAAAFKAHADAQQHYERALEHASEDSGRATLLMKIGHAARARGDSTRATEAYERALRLRREIGDYDGAADAVAFLITERLNAGTSFRVGAEMLAAADADFGASCSPLARARLTVVLAQYYAFSAQTREALETLETIPADLPLTPNIEQLKVAVHMDTAYRRGKIEAWRVAAKRSLELTPDTNISPRINIGLTGIGLGQTELAASELEIAVGNAQNWEYALAAAHARLVRAQVAYLFGRLDDARADIEAVRSASSEIARSHLTYIGPLAGFALGDDGLFEETLDRPRIERARRDENSYEWDRLSTIAALDATIRGDGKLAAALALEAGEAQIDSCVAHLVFPILADLVEIAQGSRLLQRCDELFGDPSIDSARATRSFVEAVLARRRGEFAAAREAANVARAAYARLGWRLLEAGAYAVAGEVDSAMALYRSLGALGYVRRLEGDSSETVLQRSGGATRLSTRERSIADLVASGHPNSEIAERLGISPKTVEKHLTSIFAKLGFRSRSQIAAFVASNAKASRV